MKTDDIRSSYLKFFEERGHKVCPSDSLVPSNDPTLLFTGAGMNQFKDYFLGLGKMDFRRATTAQKCIRTGDIMNVGVTPSHHTFFEMMGNFSFGDYFKPEAIEWAWEFLTGVMEIPESKLQVTVYQSDDEAFNIWKNKIGLPENRITRLGEHDNFWPADAPSEGPNGPCGPCSEIFYDRGEKRGCGQSTCDVTCECRRHVEIWNLVFTQFDRQSDGSLPPLPQKNIDTGMGLERMAACMQDADTNMDIDIFQPLVGAVAEMSGKKYGADKADDTLIKRIADHSRAVTFCIADGVLPANTHRGYVLKRLLRRAVLDGRSLSIEGAFMHKMVPMVARVMGTQYRDVAERAESIAESVLLEEEKFLGTLSRGLNLIDMAVTRAKTEGSGSIDGRTAFELYDTYGFPFELAEEVVGRDGLGIDREGFNESMEEAREIARQGAKMKGDIFAKGPMAEIKKITGGTEFTGYDGIESTAKVLAVVKGDTLVDSAEAGDEVAVVLDRTSLYGESGGQVGDTGLITGPNNTALEVFDTQKIDGIFVHNATVSSGSIKPGMEVNTCANAERRANISRNHTATHLLHWALHQVVSEKAEQRGSWVGPDRLRFDFQQQGALTREQLEKVEELVNMRVIENASLCKLETSIDEARKAGAMALFGEKYGDTVRMVSIGDFSKELCGGIHTDRTGDIGLFRILAEESVAAGIRRIEACTGLSAWRVARQESSLLSEISKSLKTPAKEVFGRLQAILEEEKALRKELAQLKQKGIGERIAQMVDEAKEVDGVKYLALDLGELDGKELRGVSDEVKKVFKVGVALLGARSGDKVSLLCTSSPETVKAGIKAGDVVREAAQLVGGKGGGRPDMAQAGGRDPEKLADALNALPEIIGKLKK